MINIKKLSWVAMVAPLLVSGCGGGSNSSSDKPGSMASPNIKGTPQLSQVSTYQGNNQSEQVLNCSKLFLKDDSCDVTNIKPIGVDLVGDVTIDDIKARLVVSHDWMADSFIAALQKINDQDLLNLFKALNTIVISYEVRPSFYHPLTAYMDPPSLQPILKR